MPTPSALLVSPPRPPIPFLPPEIVALVLSHLSPSEACPSCLVSKLWGHLGQAVVWRRLEIFPVDARTLASSQVVLFGSEEAARLGRHVKELLVDGARVFTELDLDAEPGADDDDSAESAFEQRLPRSLELSEVAFVWEWCRRTLADGTGRSGEFDGGKPPDVHLDPNLVRTDDYPIEFSPAELVDKLSVLTQLQHLNLGILLHPISGDLLPPTSSSLAKSASLRLTSLQLDDQLCDWNDVVETGEEGEGDASYTSRVIRATNKETLRALRIGNASPLASLGRSLAQSGFHLDSLSIEFALVTLPTFINTITKVLPYHRTLPSLLLIAGTNGSNPSILPQHFLSTLSHTLKKVTLGFNIVIDEGIEAYLRGPARAKLESF